MSSSAFTPAWLAREPRALALLPDRFRDPAARRAAVEAAARPVAPALIDALVARNAHAPHLLERLARPGTVAAVTGQQMGLFLGPLFTLYKAAAAIAAARALEAETGRACVPVFWMQTEDHDLPEIDHTFVPRGTGGLLRVGLGLPADSRVPVSEVRVDATAALTALRAELGAQPHAAEHLGLLERAYAPGATLADAFARLLVAVFPELLIVDPRTMPALAAPVHRRAIDEAAAIAGALQDQGAALAGAGFGEQVHVRPGSPLCFFAPDGGEATGAAADSAAASLPRTGARYRLDPAPDGFTVAGLHVTHAELRGWLERDPARFTTSALLRPLLQDTWLPTAAYVGGPGEIAYWAQLPRVYAHFGLPMPLVVPRARFRVVDDRSRALLDRLGLAPDDLAAPRDALLQRLARHEGFDPPDVAEARLVAALAPEFARLSGQMAALDPNLAKTAARTEESVRDQVAKLVAKYARALAQRDQVTVERLDRLRAYLAPDGVPQERVHGLPYYAARWGTRGFARLVLEACAPFDGALRDLCP